MSGCERASAYICTLLIRRAFIFSAGSDATHGRALALLGREGGRRGWTRAAAGPKWKLASGLERFRPLLPAGRALNAEYLQKNAQKPKRLLHGQRRRRRIPRFTLDGRDSLIFCIFGHHLSLGGLVGIQGSCWLLWRCRNKKMQMSAVLSWCSLFSETRAVPDKDSETDPMMDESRTTHARRSVRRRLYGTSRFCPFLIHSYSPRRNILPRSASSRSPCLRTITSPTRPCCTGSRPRVGPGTWG